MSVDPETTRIVRSWLDEGVTELPDRVLDAVLDELPATPQRRGRGWLARRTPIMSKIVPIGVSAAAVVVAFAIGVQLLGNQPSVGGPGEVPTATPMSTPSAEPSTDPAGGLPEGPFAYGWPGMAPDAPRITVTIPAPGWSELDAGILLKGTDLNNLPEAGIIAWSESPGTGFYVYGDPCAYASTTPETPATTVDEIVADLAAQASRDPSEPIDVAVGGYSGKRITVHVPDDADPAACEGGEFTMFGTEADDFSRYNQGPGQIDELWIIDVEGSIVIFDTMYRPDTSAELIEELRSIAASAVFEVP